MRHLDSQVTARLLQKQPIVKQTLYLFFLDTLMHFVYIPLPDEIARGQALLSHTKSLCRFGRASQRCCDRGQPLMRRPIEGPSISGA